jgi:hypothetical protein
VAPGGGPATAIVVEGPSDAAAGEALAHRLGRDLGVVGAAIVVADGVTNFPERLARLVRPSAAGLEGGPDAARPARVLGLYDEAEEAHVRRALERAGLGSGLDRPGIEASGFFVCVADLEDELIRALGRSAVTDVLEAQGELGAFRRFQQQPAQRERPLEAQLRRFMGTRSLRKIRYGRLLVDALDLERVPRPLDRLLARL